MGGSLASGVGVGSKHLQQHRKVNSHSCYVFIDYVPGTMFVVIPLTASFHLGHQCSNMEMRC